jgi:hypothetical protein
MSQTSFIYFFTGRLDWIQVNDLLECLKDKCHLGDIISVDVPQDLIDQYNDILRGR